MKLRGNGHPTYEGKQKFVSLQIDGRGVSCPFKSVDMRWGNDVDFKGL